MKHRVNQFHRSSPSCRRSCRTLYSRTSSAGINRGTAFTLSACMPLRRLSCLSTSGMPGTVPSSGSSTCTASTSGRPRRTWVPHFTIRTLARRPLTWQPWLKGAKNKTNRKVAKMGTVIQANRAKFCIMNQKVPHRRIKTA